MIFSCKRQQAGRREGEMGEETTTNTDAGVTHSSFRLKAPSPLIYVVLSFSLSLVLHLLPRYKRARCVCAIIVQRQTGGVCGTHTLENTKHCVLVERER